jgi:hypothetical protein
MLHCFAILACLVISQVEERDASRVVSERMSFILTQKADGSFRGAIRSKKKIRTVLPMLQLINSTVLDELELIEKQNKAWVEQIETLSGKVDRIQEQLDNDTVIHQSELDDLFSAESNAIDSFKAELVPHQIDLLREVFAVLEIRRVGLPAFFVFGSGKSMLKLKPYHLAKIERKYRSESARIAEEVRDVKLDSIRELLSILTAQQLKDFDKLVGNGDAFASTPCSIFLLQLEDSFVKEVENDVVSDFEEFEGFTVSQSFSVALNGKLTVHRKNAKSVEAKDIRVINGLLYFCQRNADGVQLKFSKEQRDSIRELVKANSVFQKQEEQVFSKHLQQNGYDGIKELAEEQFDKRHEFSRKLMGKLLELLNDKQHGELKKLSRMLELRSLGLLATLVHSDFAEELKLTVEQKNSILKAGPKVAESAKEELMRLEDSIHQELFKCLDDDQRGMMKRLKFLDLPLETGYVEMHHFIFDPKIFPELQAASDDAAIFVRALR